MGTADPTSAWPFAVYAACVAAVVVVMVGASYVLGQRHLDRATGLPYESGVAAQGSARLRMTSQFYLMAMLFVVFDLEAVFIFVWAVAARELGWAGYGAITLFVGLLLVALVYLWRAGALVWGPSHRLSPIEPGAAKAGRG